ncbi:MAG: prolyl oligopeptidase family serine peptidase [Pseudomonadota bacterium]|nr:prolyl oligopeptidase family serine peptidase [Pseudomonadota bacterium]
MSPLSASRPKLDMMGRCYLSLLILPVLLAGSVASAARIDRDGLIFDNVAEPSPELADRLAAYLSARQAAPLGWSPRGQLLIRTRFGEVDQLHVVEKAGGERRQLTFQRAPIAAGNFSPDPLHPGYWYTQDAGGQERSQIYFQPTAETAPRRLTDGKSANGAPLWSNSGREIAFFSTARDGVSRDIDIVEPAAGTLPHLAVTGDGAAAWYPLDWSPDDRQLLVLRYVSTNEGYLYVIDLASGQRHEVDPAPGKTGITTAKFSRDGQGVYVLSNRDSEFTKLRYVSLFTADRTVLSERAAGDVEAIALSRDGHYLAYVSNEAGLSKLALLDLRTHQALKPPELPGNGVIDDLCFDGEGKRLAFGYTTAVRPRDAFVYDVAGGRADAWTHSEPGPLDPSKFVTPQLTQFPTFDRTDGHVRQLPVYVFEPRSAGPHPVLLILHDGPEMQFRPTFDPWIQFVVNELGFAVVAPNIRGSSGYGKTYSTLDSGLQRDDAVKDLGALIVWVDSQSAFDPKRVIASGAGYGGYLALAALINYGDRLSGAVDMGGMSDLVTFLTGTSPYLQNWQRAVYGDERDPDMRAYLRRLSPLNNADRLTRPLLVVHGQNDARVPVSESEQLVARLRSRGSNVGYLQVKNEGRELRRQPDREAYLGAFALFLTSPH